MAARFVVVCDDHVSDPLGTRESAERHLASVVRLGACKAEHVVLSAEDHIAEQVILHTGCDPRVEPEFGGIGIEPCAQCRTVTAVTTLSLDGERFARICAACLRGAP